MTGRYFLELHLCPESGDEFLCSLINSMHLRWCQHQWLPHIICCCSIVPPLVHVFFTCSCHSDFLIIIESTSVCIRWKILVSCRCYWGWYALHKELIDVYRRDSFLVAVGKKSTEFGSPFFAFTMGLEGQGCPENWFACRFEPIRFRFSYGLGSMELVQLGL